MPVDPARAFLGLILFHVEQSRFEASRAVGTSFGSSLEVVVYGPADLPVADWRQSAYLTFLFHVEHSRTTRRMTAFSQLAQEARALQILMI